MAIDSQRMTPSSSRAWYAVELDHRVLRGRRTLSAGRAGGRKSVRRTEVDAAGAVATRTGPTTIPAVVTSTRVPRFWQRRNLLREVAQR